jgi:hypothetical protein
MQNENGARKNKSKQKEFIILAGEMKIVGNKLKPNPAKGQIRFYINPDDILCFEWIDLESKTSNEPLAIFEEEWEWKKIETMKGRLYFLQSKNFPEERSFYWMQYPNKAEDSLNEKIINKILRTGKLEIEEENGQGDDVEMTVENIVKREESMSNQASNFFENNNIPTGNNQNVINNADFIKNFASALRNVDKRVEKFPALGKILSKGNIIKSLNDKDIEELCK